MKARRAATRSMTKVLPISLQYLRGGRGVFSVKYVRSIAGSCSNTSRPTAATVPESRAASRALQACSASFSRRATEQAASPTPAGAGVGVGESVALQRAAYFLTKVTGGGFPRFDRPGRTT